MRQVDFSFIFFVQTLKSFYDECSQNTRIENQIVLVPNILNLAHKILHLFKNPSRPIPFLIAHPNSPVQVQKNFQNILKNTVIFASKFLMD